jgi:DNA-binding NarL/FixJ family response regulator
MQTSTAKKIFIIDDDEMLTMALSDYLTRSVSHDIQVYHTGEEALKRLDEEPDVVVLDFHLNTVNQSAANGLEILKQIRKQMPNVRVIMLSSQESYGKAAQTIQKGAENYVIKGEKSFHQILELI